MDPFADVSMLSSAGHAFMTLIQLDRITFLWAGVLVGLVIGLIPGIGGLTGFALLVPFTFTMDPIAAFAMLLGMHAVISTSDVIPAILLGVPGTASSQATVLDGFQMTKKGEAGRALSASYCASMFGGLIGAFLLAVSIPIVRPLALSVGTPELLALTIFGIAMVASLSGTAPLRGLIAACLGILIGMIGTNVQSGELRWTGDLIYLREGVPLLPVLLGIFALPELCDLAIQRSALAEKIKFSAISGMFQGIRDCLRHWFLIVRCSVMGAVLGTVPGITGSVADWFAYGHALQTEKGAKETFSKGDVRGVIAPESANNAKESGMLVPMLAFGVPGGAAQAILLGALMIHGFIPGPDMLTRNLDVTYTMVWSIALANIFGAGVCFLLSGQLAKISTLRYTLVLPSIMAIVFIGAFQGSKSWGDLYVLLIAGVAGWIMKRLKWPRPPLILGLVLGVLIERYMAISILRYDFEWLARPGVIVLLTLACVVMLSPLYKKIRHEGLRTFVPRSKPVFHASDLLYVVLIVVAGYMFVAAQHWSFNARIGPTWVSATLIVAAMLSLLNQLCYERAPEEKGRSKAHMGIHMDVASVDGLQMHTVLLRFAIFFGWLLAFLALMAVIGLIPSVLILIIAFMRLEGREPWKLTLTLAVSATVFIYIVFDRVLLVPWPPTLMGAWFPALAELIPSM
jgi:putative tricarboxylic transport membrane protein